jgi:PKD repeat protein
MPRIARTLALSALLLGAIPAVGLAKTYCVGAPAGVTCDGGSSPFTASGFNTAVTSADGASGPNTVRVAEGTITGVSSVFINGGVIVTGAGRGKTILESAQVNGGAFTAFGTDAGITDLTFKTTAVSSSATLVNVSGGGVIERVAIIEASAAPTNQPVTALQLTGTSATDVDITTNSTYDQGIDLYGTGALTDISVTGPGMIGVTVDAPGTVHTFDRLRISGYATGLFASSVDGLFLRDSLIDLGGTTGGLGIEASMAGGSDPIGVTATRVAIIGRGPNQTGVRLGAISSGQTPAVQLSDTLVDLTNGTDLLCTAGGGSSPNLTASRSAFRTQQREAGCGGTASSILNLTTTPPTYRNAASRDYRPAWNSPVIDAGSNSSPTQTADLDGATRFVDGNGAGGGAIDLGPFEYQRRAPAAPTVSAPVVSATVPATFTASATDPDGDPLTYTWTFGDGTTGSGSTPTHTYAAAGTYAVGVTVADPTGRTSSASANVVVAAAPTPTPTPTGSATSGAGQTPGTPQTSGTSATPRLTLVAAPSRASRRSARGLTISATPTRTSATLRADGATALRITLTRLTAGRRTGARCRVKATSGKRCTVRTAINGASSLQAPAGTFGLAIGGTFAGRRLAAGSYEVRAEPRNASGVAGTAVTFHVTLR